MRRLRKSSRTHLLCCVLAACAFIVACSEEPEIPAAASPPGTSVKNLLLICIDTVRADVFYAFGEARADAFNPWRERALAFRHAIASSSWTVPSVATVFSGLWQYGHGAGLMPSIEIKAGISPLTPVHKPTPLHEDVPLLTESAERAGFQTVAISASPWTNSPESPVGLTKGFEEIIEIRQTDSGRGFAKMREALARKEADAPFFHYMHFMEAHDWHIVPESKLDQRIARFSPEERALYLQVAPVNACVDEASLVCKRFLVYASAVDQLRQSLSALLTKMENRGLLDDTAVVLFSDHGERFGDHEDDDRIARSIRELPEKFVGHGQSMYQELIHVPILVWHPAYEGSVIRSLVSLVDIAPTVAQWLDLDFLPEQWPGHYLHDQLDSSTAALDRVAYASGIVKGEQQIGAVRGMNKSIWYMVSDQYDYYDLAEDPLESRSLRRDDLVLKFDGYFTEYLQHKRNVQRQAVSLSDKQLKALQAIGYLQGLEEEGAEAKE